MMIMILFAVFIGDIGKPDHVKASTEKDYECNLSWDLPNAAKIILFGYR